MILRRFPYFEQKLFIFDGHDNSSIINNFLRYFNSIHRKHATEPIGLFELKEKERIMVA